jgi:hypothetical protein
MEEGSLLNDNDRHQTNTSLSREKEEEKQEDKHIIERVVQAIL